MEEIIPDPLLLDTDNGAQLHSLFDAALAQQREEMSQFTSRWEELKRDQGLRVAASSFIVCPANAINSVEISVECESPRDLVMWKLCFTTAITKLSIIYADFETYSRKVSANIDYVNAGAFLDFIDPLVHKTDFERRENTSAVALPDSRTDAEHTERLHQLIDSVLDQQRIESEQLISHWEQLKSNPNQRMEMEELKLFSQAGNEVELAVSFESPNDRLLWKWIVIAALLELDIPEIKTYSRRLFKVIVDVEIMKRVLHSTKPLVNRISFQQIHIDDLQPDIMYSLSDFIGTKCIQSLTLSRKDSENEDYNLWLDFIRKFTPRLVCCDRQGISNEIQDFLLPLADMVDAIVIGVHLTPRLPLEPMSIATVREMFSRKCKLVCLNKKINSLSLAEAEDLVEFLHHLDKKVFLQMTTDIGPMDIQIGEYKLKTESELFFPEQRIILIKHESYNPAAK